MYHTIVILIAKTSLMALIVAATAVSGGFCLEFGHRVLTTRSAEVNAALRWVVGTVLFAVSVFSFYVGMTVFDYVAQL
jgi:hypothetical protein